MKCPVDNETLLMTMREGVEIDYCPKCRGVWLDRGELDKLIGAAAQQPLSQPVQAAAGYGAAPPPLPEGQAYGRPAADYRRDAPRDLSQGRDSYRRRDDDDDDDRDRDGYRRYDDYKGHKRRKGGFLADIFDF
ncbi:zf-TFIIB domain-containing protein [Pseudogemmobacter faecipullorum]|uniref:Zf-TFIIB domain-containing protein n=1 Tax=Pseudogemmobacter faecipullorum TaxID=2755041 RepID=A0ABS8CMI6_9RHOB|nr:zf-TFIIB domain-containing protein [Pseudogemmobacter faecipullorum]